MDLRDQARLPDGDSASLWRQLQRLVDRVSTAVEGDAAVDDCLDILVELLEAARGLILLDREDGTTAVVNSRGPRRPLSASEREEMSRTLIRRCVESDDIVVWNGIDHPIDSTSVLSLGITASMVAPLRGRGAARRGVVYVDFRKPRLSVDEADRQFFVAAVAIIGSMVEQAASTRNARERLVTAASHFTQCRRRPPLADLLRPAGMKRAKPDIELALASDAPVLVLGESGTGKTLFAEAIAEESGRRPIVRVVLGGSDDLNTVTSELFGHERGAFSGATAKRIGLVGYADGGTLILDEILNLPIHAQKLLLDFTQFGTYRPLGHDRPEPKRATVRVIAATNGDMRAAMREGRFREDLFHRLTGITVNVPPLRDRRGDLCDLAQSALARIDAVRAWTLSLDFRKRLESSAYAWPGNIRELEWVVHRARDRAVLRDPNASELCERDLDDLATGNAAGEEDVLDLKSGSAAEAWSRIQRVKERLEEREREFLREVLDRHGGVVAQAAKELGIARTTLASRGDVLRPSRGRNN